MLEIEAIYRTELSQCRQSSLQCFPIDMLDWFSGYLQRCFNCICSAASVYREKCMDTSSLV
jgi:hypothetical protein